MASNFSSSFDFAFSSVLTCFMSPPLDIIAITSGAANIVIVLPLCTVVLHDGVQHWRKQSSSSAAMSHSDCFTHHMVVMELVGVFGSAIGIFGNIRRDLDILLVGLLFFAFTWFGQISFHALTCAERYLAVVHPVTYLRLRNETGIRIRNVSIVCVWLLSVLGTGLLMLDQIIVIFDSVLLISFSLVISFCCISVLFVLMRPGPGEQGGNRERVDQSKKRAFYTVVAILGVLVFRFTGNLIWISVFLSGRGADCVVAILQILFSLPSSLVLPLLFLHRKGKLLSCKRQKDPLKL